MAAGGRVAVTGVGAFATVLLARVLGPGGFGAYSVALSLVLILTAAATLGVEHGITYFVSAGSWSARAAHVTSLKVSVVMGLAGAAVGLGFRLLVPSAFAGLSVGLVAVAVAGLPFVLAALYASYVALAADRYEAYTAIPVFQAFLVLALAVPAAIVFDVRGAVVGMTMSVLAVGVGSAVWGRRRLPDGRAPAPGSLRRAISFGVKGYAANALQLLNYRLDLFILAGVASSAAVGRYSTAVAVTSLLGVLPRALADVLFPRVAYLSTRGDHAALGAVEAKSLRHLGMLTAVTMLLVVAALELLVVPVFGSGFRPAVDLGLILLPGTALVGISAVLASSVVGRGKPAYSLYVALVSTPLTIILYATFIPWLESTGAALASSLSYLCSFLLISWFYRRVTGQRVLPLLVPTRSELDDLFALRRSARAWARASRR